GPAGDISRRRDAQVESANDPADLVNHVLGHIAAGKFPVESPVDEFVRVEGAVRAAVQKRLPIHVLRVAIFGDRANPLALAARRVAAHPRLDARDLADQTVLDPLPGIHEIAFALVLLSDADDAIGSLLRRSQTAFGLFDRPGHGLFAVHVFACGERINEMPRVAVERSGDDHRVNILRSEQRPMIVDTLAAGKDMNCEKTMTWSIEEAESCLAAAKKASNRVIGVGQQHQSEGYFADARKWVKDGLVGKGTSVESWMSRNTPRGKAQWFRPIPEDCNAQNVDWKAFLNGRPNRPFDAYKFINWRLYWEFSGGNVTENMVHQIGW